MKKILFVAIIVIISGISVFAFTKKRIIQSPEKKEMKGFAVIELFTSEGCSSCPPADDAIAEIQKEYKDKNVLALGFHVDYWDRLGWKDPFSSPDFTSRQNYYAGIFNLNSIYTPQAVVNGKSEFVGSDKNKIISTIDKQLESKSETIINLKATQGNSGKIEINYSAQNNNSAQNQLVVLLVQKNASNNIKRGENEGKTLHHINIVRKISYLPISAKEETLSFNTPDGYKKGDFFIAAFTQNKKTGILTGLATSEIN